MTLNLINVQITEKCPMGGDVIVINVIVENGMDDSLVKTLGENVR